VIRFTNLSIYLFLMDQATLQNCWLIKKWAKLH